MPETPFIYKYISRIKSICLDGCGGGIFNNESIVKMLFVLISYDIAGRTRDIFANFRGSVDRAELF